MNMTVSEIAANKRRKFLIQITSGGMFGAVVGYFGAEVLMDAAVAGDQMLVIVVGAMYLVMGLFCGFGVAFPKAGSKLLNVEDEEELYEQQRMLTGSAIAMSALGAALIALSLSGPGQYLPPLAGLGALLTAMIVLIVITIRDWKHYDELMLGVSRDAGNFAFVGVGTLLLLWGAGAWLGYLVAPSPLTLVAMVSGGLLISVFVVSGRRGLLHPR